MKSISTRNSLDAGDRAGKIDDLHDLMSHLIGCSVDHEFVKQQDLGGECTTLLAINQLMHRTMHMVNGAGLLTLSKPRAYIYPRPP